MFFSLDLDELTGFVRKYVNNVSPAQSSGNTFNSLPFESTRSFWCVLQLASQTLVTESTIDQLTCQEIPAQVVEGQETWANHDCKNKYKEKRKSLELSNA